MQIVVVVTRTPSQISLPARVTTLVTNPLEQFVMASVPLKSHHSPGVNPLSDRSTVPPLPVTTTLLITTLPTLVTRPVNEITSPTTTALFGHVNVAASAGNVMPWQTAVDVRTTLVPVHLS